MFQWWRDRRYVKAREAGRVAKVQTGIVVVGDREYSGMCKTFVHPGQMVAKGAILGKL